LSKSATVLKFIIPANLIKEHIPILKSNRGLAVCAGS